MSLRRRFLEKLLAVPEHRALMDEPMVSRVAPGWTAMHSAVANGCSARCVKMLVDAGADRFVGSDDDYDNRDSGPLAPMGCWGLLRVRRGATPLLIAVKEVRLDCVKALLRDDDDDDARRAALGPLKHAKSWDDDDDDWNDDPLITMPGFGKMEYHSLKDGSCRFTYEHELAIDGSAEDFHRRQRDWILRDHKDRRPYQPNEVEIGELRAHQWQATLRAAFVQRKRENLSEIVRVLTAYVSDVKELEDSEEEDAEEEVPEEEAAPSANAEAAPPAADADDPMPDAEAPAAPRPNPMGATLMDATLASDIRAVCASAAPEWKELQRLAKALGIKVNQKSAALVEKLEHALVDVAVEVAAWPPPPTEP